MTLKYIVLLVALMAMAFVSFSFMKCKSKQGLQGYIYYVSGNRMPSPDRKLPAPKGIATTLYIYALTSRSQAASVNQSPFYKTISTKFIKAVKSNKDGYFKVNLPPGEYSLFTKKDSLFYANIFEGDNIAPVKVEPGKFTEVKVTVDYDAVY